MTLFAKTSLTLALVLPTTAHAQQTNKAQQRAAASKNQVPRTMTISRGGSRSAQKAPPEHFVGAVSIEPFFAANAPARANGGSVTFAPCARSDWHTHPLGQTLIVTEGTGLVQRWGGPIEVIRKGDVIWTPPGVRHWHGATARTSMTHIAVQENIGGSNVTWLERVSDEQYNKQPALSQTATQGTKAMNPNTKKEPSAIRKNFGEFAPKFADLTDDVLFGDVWERPGLSKRDRSLVTVAALIAGGSTEQLTAHLNLAKKNGVTEPELIEAITHLAFYVGWPKAMSAMTVAKEVFQKP